MNVEELQKENKELKEKLAKLLRQREHEAIPLFSPKMQRAGNSEILRMRKNHQ